MRESPDTAFPLHGRCRRTLFAGSLVHSDLINGRQSDEDIDATRDHRSLTAKEAADIPTQNTDQEPIQSPHNQENKGEFVHAHIFLYIVITPKKFGIDPRVPVWHTSLSPSVYTRSVAVLKNCQEKTSLQQTGSFSVFYRAA